MVTALIRPCPTAPLLFHSGDGSTTVESLSLKQDEDIKSRSLPVTQTGLFQHSQNRSNQPRPIADFSSRPAGMLERPVLGWSSLTQLAPLSKDDQLAVARFSRRQDVIRDLILGCI